MSVLDKIEQDEKWRLLIDVLNRICARINDLNETLKNIEDNIP